MRSSSRVRQASAEISASPLGKPSLASTARHSAKAVRPKRGIEHDAARGEEAPQALEARDRIGEPMQRHARDDEVEPGMAAGLARIHHLEADMGRCRAGARFAPAFGDHGGGDIGQHEAPFGIALDQVAAEQAGAAAELEHAGALKLGQDSARAYRQPRAGARREAHSSRPARRSVPQSRRYDGRAWANSRT